MEGIVGNAALGSRGEWYNGRQSAGAGSLILELYFWCPKDSSKGVGNVLSCPFPIQMKFEKTPVNVNLREARHLLEVRHCPCTMSVQFQLQLPRQKVYFYIQCCSQMKEKECWYPVSFETMVQVERRPSAKVQIDYRLRDAHSRTRAAYSKLPVDPCATRSL
jgi:hypothetical protein